MLGLTDLYGVVIVFSAPCQVSGPATAAALL